MTTPNTPHDSLHLVVQELLLEVKALRLEAQAIAKSNARIVALLERKFFSEGEPIRFGGS